MSILKVDELQSRTSGNRITLPDVNNYPPYRNLIINGDMSIAQRGTSTASITGSGYHTIDRYRTGISGTFGTWTQSQSIDVPSGQGFAKSLKMDCTTADASPAVASRLVIRQNFEGQMLQSLKKGTSNAESLTLSFWVKSNKTGTYIAHLADHDNTRSISKSYTISSSSTWEKKTITFAGDTTGALDNDNALSMYIDWYLGAGTNYTSGTLGTSWSSTTDANIAVGQVNLADNTANEWYITGVQLEVGTSATPFEHLPTDISLQRCQRYFQFMGGVASGFPMMQVYGISGSDMRTPLSFPTTMRASPTATVNGTWQTLNTANPTFDFLSPEGCCMRLDVSGGSGQTYAHPNSTDDYVTFDSEL